MTRWLAEATRSTPQDIPESWLKEPEQPALTTRATRRLRRIDEPRDDAESELDDLLDLEYQDKETDNIRNALS